MVTRATLQDASYGVSNAHFQSRSRSLVHLCSPRDGFRGLALHRQFRAGEFAGGIAIAAAVCPKTFRPSQRRRNAAWSDFRRNLIIDLRFRRAARRAQKSGALAHRKFAALVARPHLANLAHHPARHFAQRFSPRRADDDASRGSLRDRDGERHLWTGAATSTAADHEGTTAG